MSHSDPTRIGEVLEASPLPKATLDVPEDHWDVQRARARQQREDRRKRSMTDGSLLAMGTRYRDCTLDNFRIDNESQRAVVMRLRRFMQTTHERIPNVLLFGPKGTGKDHLLTALVRWGGDLGLGVQWVNGLDLFAQFRDFEKAQEFDQRSQLVAADVLAISDPLPPSGDLTTWQQENLARLLDSRYRRALPTWATLNVASGAEAEQRLGPLITDRLRDGAVALACCWESFRRASTEWNEKE